MAQATTLFDAADRPAFTIYKEQRIEVPLQKVSPHLVRALVAIEDQRFYDHRGVDTVRVLGAVLANLRQGRRAQGGSTITQQLARQSFLTPDKTFTRKLQEVFVAAQSSARTRRRRFSSCISTRCTSATGSTAPRRRRSATSASTRPTSRSIEAALLAGLVKSPSTYAPTVSPERAVARRNLVLQAMVEAGAITKAQAEQARATKLALQDGLRQDEPHGLVLQGAGAAGARRALRLGARLPGRAEGLHDDRPDMQKAAELQVAKSLEEIEKRRARDEAQRSSVSKGRPAAAPAQPPLQAALVAHGSGDRPRPRDGRRP